MARFFLNPNCYRRPGRSYFYNRESNASEWCLYPSQLGYSFSTTPKEPSEKPRRSPSETQRHHPEETYRDDGVTNAYYDKAAGWREGMHWNRYGAHEDQYYRRPTETQRYHAEETSRLPHVDEPRGSSSRSHSLDHSGRYNGDTAKGGEFNSR